MASRPDAAPDPRAEARRHIPSVDDLLAHPRLIGLVTQVDRALVVDAARTVLDRLRESLAMDPGAVSCVNLDALAESISAEIAGLLAPSLRPVINATGVILHTNLGRAPLSAAAIERIRATSGGYSNLEYDLALGARGKRDSHTDRLLARLTGAEAAVVVNNNAAAVLLVLAALARDGEVIVSRGELIEVGESFRIPDVMAESGAVLREIGTTNRTAIGDYERALGQATRLLLRVHRSNFRIVGFTARPSLGELVALGRRASVPVYEDLGSGCLVDLSSCGIREPVVRASIEAGADIVSFSGDKLLGGPQAGIIVGRRELIARVRKHPLFRALRADKLAIAALEATLNIYLRGHLDSLPAVRMIRAPAAAIERRATLLLAGLAPLLPLGLAELTLTHGESVIGGGSTPDERLPTRLIEIAGAKWSASQLEARLRAPEDGIAVLARVARDRLMLDLRTVFPEEEPHLVTALAVALH